VTGTASRSTKACRHRSMSYKLEDNKQHLLITTSQSFIVSKMDRHIVFPHGVKGPWPVRGVAYWVVNFECKLYIPVKFL